MKAIVIFCIVLLKVASSQRTCPFKKGNVRLSRKGSNQGSFDEEEQKITEEEALISALEGDTGSSTESNLLSGDIAGGQATFVEKPVIFNWGCSEVAPSVCDGHGHYKGLRTISGVCNNLKHPIWGASSTMQPRLINSTYNDYFNAPRGGWKSSEGHCCTGHKTSITRKHCESRPFALLPNPRLVRRHFHRTESMSDANATLLFTVFGQFLDHDLSLTPESPAKKECCSSEESQTGCFPMKEVCYPACMKQATCSYRDQRVLSPARDFQAAVLKDRCSQKFCYAFKRSLNYCSTGQSPTNKREQINAITSFIDASMVYGSDIETHRQLREPHSPFMLLSAEANAVPPGINATHALAGDKRCTEVPELLAFHTLFLREHNRIVAEVIDHLSERKDSRQHDTYFVFEKARQLLIAVLQNIVYGQYLPVLLGNETLNKEAFIDDEGSQMLSLHNSSRYVDSINPGIANEFSTAAYRFGHSMIHGVIKKHALNVNGSMTGQYRDKDNFFCTKEFSSSGNLGLELILNGLSKAPSECADPLMDSDYTEHLFENNNDFGDDLGARNIQRGRDHGIAGYNEYREFCGMSRVCSWNDRPEEISAAHWTSLSQLYDHPSDIDLFTAGLAENPYYAGGTVGRTFNCIIREQFMRLKLGDRFFFTHLPDASDQGAAMERFNEAQIEHLKQRRLRDILCDNTDVEEMREDVFVMSSPCTLCPERSRLDISLFL